jgi:hypothetical protein
MDLARGDGLTHLYALVDPRNGAVGYIGKAKWPHERYQAHLSSAYTPRLSRKGRWIREMLDAGVAPKLRILDSVDGDGHIRERELIAEYDSLFLTNEIRVPVPSGFLGAGEDSMTTYVVLQEHPGTDGRDEFLVVDTVEAANAEQARRKVAEALLDADLDAGVTMIAVPERNWRTGRGTVKAEMQRKIRSA